MNSGKRSDTRLRLKGRIKTNCHLCVSIETSVKIIPATVFFQLDPSSSSETELISSHDCEC